MNCCMYPQRVNEAKEENDWEVEEDMRATTKVAVETVHQKLVDLLNIIMFKCLISMHNYISVMIGKM